MSTDFRQLYFETAREYVHNIQNTLQTTAPNSDQSVFENLHRYAHSLKSQSTVMQFTQIAELAGYLEQIFDQIKNGEKTFSPEIEGATKASANALASALTSLEQGKTNISDLNDNIVNLKKLI